MYKLLPHGQDFDQIRLRQISYARHQLRLAAKFFPIQADPCRVSH